MLIVGLVRENSHRTLKDARWGRGSTDLTKDARPPVPRGPGTECSKPTDEVTAPRGANTTDGRDCKTGWADATPEWSRVMWSARSTTVTG